MDNPDLPEALIIASKNIALGLECQGQAAAQAWSRAILYVGGSCFIYLSLKEISKYLRHREYIAGLQAEQNNPQ